MNHDALAALVLHTAEPSRTTCFVLDDFGALDMEGLARSGEHLGHLSPALDHAISAFTRARRLTSAPGITEQLIGLLRDFNDDRLNAAIEAASGRL